MRSKLMLATVLCLAACKVGAVCPDPRNRIANCGFEIDDSGWQVLPAPDTTLVRSTADAHSGIASGQVQAADSGFLLLRSGCLSLPAALEIGFGAYLRHVSGTPPTTCKAQLRQNSDEGCVTAANFADTPLESVDASAWRPVSRSLTTTALTRSALLDVSCIGVDATTIMRIDDVFLGESLLPPLFGDGFESGVAPRPLAG